MHPFELVTGQTPFDNIMPNKNDLMQKWLATFDDLPEDWKAHTNVALTADVERMSLPEWLHHCYFVDEDKAVEFAGEHIEGLGDLLTKMMRYRPEDRLSTREILEHRWFKRNPFGECE